MCSTGMLMTDVCVYLYIVCNVCIFCILWCTAAVSDLCVSVLPRALGVDYRCVLVLLTVHGEAT